MLVINTKIFMMFVIKDEYVSSNIQFSDEGIGFLKHDSDSDNFLELKLETSNSEDDFSTNSDQEFSDIVNITPINSLDTWQNFEVKTESKNFPVFNNYEKKSQKKRKTISKVDFKKNNKDLEKKKSIKNQTSFLNFISKVVNGSSSETTNHSNKIANLSNCMVVSQQINVDKNRLSSINKLSSNENQNSSKTSSSLKINDNSLNQKEGKQKIISDQGKELLKSFTLHCDHCNDTYDFKGEKRSKCSKCNLYFKYKCKLCNCLLVLSHHIGTHIRNYCKAKEGKQKIISDQGRAYLKSITLHCDHCNETYDLKEQKHSKCLKCNLNFKYKCKLCDNLFIDYFKIGTHIRNYCKGKEEDKEFLKSITLHCDNCNDTYDFKGQKRSKCSKCNLYFKYKCKLCDDRFREYQQIGIHIRNCCKAKEGKQKIISDQGGAYLNSITLHCDHCNDTYDLKEQKHSKCLKCNLNFKYKCKLCDNLFIDYYKIGTHIRSYCKGKDPNYYCDQCDYHHQLKKYLRIHIEKTHASTENICSTCKQSYNHKYELAKHEKICGFPPHLICKFCSFKTKYSPQMRYHIIKKHSQVIKSSYALDNLMATIREEGKKFLDDAKKSMNNGSLKFIQRKKTYYVSSKVNRYCTKCDKIITIMGNNFLKNCPNCETLLLYECKKCQRRTKAYGVMYHHIKHICYPVEFFYCDHCDFKTCIKRSMVDHLHMLHFKLFPDYTCPKCKKSIKYPYKHSKFCDKKNKLFECQICPKQYKIRRSFNEHMHYHRLHDSKMNKPNLFKNDSNPLNNSSENIMNKTGNNLKLKKKIQDGKKGSLIYQFMISYCPDCKDTTSYKKCKTHCQICNTKYSFHCQAQNCYKKYNDSRHLYNHVSRVHSASAASYKCEICFKTYSRVHFLKKHRIRCQAKKDTKIYYCDHCPFKSDVKSSLRHHIESVHMPLEKMECKNCGKKYKNKKSIQSHSMICGKKLYFQCDICNFMCKEKHKVSKHIQTQHIDIYTKKELKCHICNVEMKNIYLFEEHVKICGI